jgi:hypothetical protein
MMTMNYVGFADRTAKPVHCKWKARSKPDWAWKPYYVGQPSSVHGRIKVYRPDEQGTLRRVRSLAPGRVKHEQRG